jgi:hypothetical protein
MIVNSSVIDSTKFGLGFNKSAFAISSMMLVNLESLCVLNIYLANINHISGIYCQDSIALTWRPTWKSSLCQNHNCWREDHIRIMILTSKYTLLSIITMKCDEFFRVFQFLMQNIWNLWPFTTITITSPSQATIPSPDCMLADEPIGGLDRNEIKLSSKETYLCLYHADRCESSS